tara:strand:+ start:508 stop:1146 length:639 start_codon:yes stop_codon:yes gene_type:complete
MTFIIAIDGHAASGKGTIAKGVAEWFGFAYLDTGLIYRSVAQQALLKRKKRLLSKKAIINIARSFKPEYLESENLRSSEVGNYASEIASIAEVRSELINFQRDFANKSQGAVLDGRDIGTVIVPDAQLKLFITADLNTRAERRYKELRQRDKSITFLQILDDLSKRDCVDSSRQYSPLKITKDAHLIDTSELSIEASIDFVIDLVNRLNEKE